MKFFLTILAILNLQKISASSSPYESYPGQYCNNDEPCSTGICLGVKHYPEINEDYGVCCVKSTDSGCLECALYDGEDNLTPKVPGSCSKCMEGLYLSNGSCLKDFNCKKKKCLRKLNQKCCWKCKKPCAGGLACVNGVCVPINTEAPTPQPTS